MFNFNEKGQFDIPEGYKELDISEKEKEAVIDLWTRKLSFEEILKLYDVKRVIITEKFDIEIIKEDE